MHIDVETEMIRERRARLTTMQWYRWIDGSLPPCAKVVMEALAGSPQGPHDHEVVARWAGLSLEATQWVLCALLDEGRISDFSLDGADQPTYLPHEFVYAQPVVQREYSTVETMGLIYALRDTERQMVKIGFSRENVEARRVALEKAGGVELRLIGTIAGTLRDEKSVHESLAADRVRGEWFASTPRVEAWVSTLDRAA